MPLYQYYKYLCHGLVILYCSNNNNINKNKHKLVLLMKFQKKEKKIITSFVPFLLGFAKCPQIAVEKMERGSDDIAV